MTIPSYILVLIVAAELDPTCGIRQPCLDDVAQRYGVAYTLDDVARDRAKAIEVMRLYLSLWVPPEQRTDTLMCMAVWRGGPRAARDKWSWFHYMEQGRRNLEEYRRAR